MNNIERMKKVKTKEADTEEVNQNEASEFAKLNDECLIVIFQHLSTIADKIRIERVCKRWKMLSRYSWQKFKHLDFCCETWGFKRKRFILMDSNIFEKVVGLCGRRLTSVSLSLEAFRQICHLNSNIQELHLFDVKYHDDRLMEDHLLTHTVEGVRESYIRGWLHRNVIIPLNCELIKNEFTEITKCLMLNGKNITTFKLELSHNFYQSEDYERLFAAMIKLKTLYITDCAYIKFEVAYLNNMSFETIEDITLQNLQKNSGSLLSLIIKKCKKLRKVYLTELQDQDILTILEALSFHSKSLKWLKLRSIENVQFREDVVIDPQILSKYNIYVSKLIHLEHLDLSDFAHLSDDLMITIGKNCKQLTYLNVSGCEDITDEGFSTIGNLQKLSTLHIYALTKLQNPPLEKLSALEVLDCGMCFNLGWEPLYNVLTKSSRLRIINMTLCDNAFKTAEAIENAIETRRSDIPLNVYGFYYLIRNGTIDVKSKTIINNSLHSEYCPPNQDHEGIRKPQIRFIPQLVPKFYAASE